MGDSPFLIAGGGIAGLAAALGLAKISREAHVFERSATFQETGAGLQLGPNAAAALVWLGAWEAVDAHCFTPSEIHVRDGRDGQLLQRIRLGRAFEQRFGMPYRVVLRSHLLEGLVQTAFGQELIHLQTGVEISPSVAYGQYSGLIGADGIHSKTRVALQCTDNKQHQSHTLYRKLLAADRCPAGIELDAVTLWLCPGGHIVHYLVNGGQSFNIVAVIDEEESRAAPVLADLSPAAGDVLHTAGDWLAWPGYDLKPDSQWSKGDKVLVGDAAHGMLPFLAQGAAMALEDACILAQELAREPDAAQAFSAYASRRFPRAGRVQRASRQQGGIYHMKGAMRLARNAALRLMPESLFLKRLAWIYDWRP